MTFPGSFFFFLFYLILLLLLLLLWTEGKIEINLKKTIWEK